MNNSASHIVRASFILFLCSSAFASWTQPEPLTEVNSQYGDGWQFLSTDGLTLYFSRWDTPDGRYAQLYKATRTSPTGVFTNVRKIYELAYSGGHVRSAWVSPDNLRMYFFRTEPGSRWRLKISTRETASSDWGPPQNLTEINNLGDVTYPNLSSDELTIVFCKFENFSKGYIYTASRSNRDSDFTNIREVTELNTSDVRARYLSPDGLTLYFARNDNGVYHNYKSTRATRDGIFEEPVLLNNWPEDYSPDCFSADGKTAYLGYYGDIYVSYLYPDNSYFVDAGIGDDTNSGSSLQNPVATIQKAIDAAPEGYTIFVKAGTYPEAIDFDSKAITIQGLAGPDGVPVLEIPDDIAVTFIKNEGPDSVLKNFVIKNCATAILIVESSPTISNVTIVDNLYGVKAFGQASPDISNCIFWNNTEGDISGCESRYCLTSEAGEGNIFANPMFVNPEEGDYHLKSKRGRYWSEHQVWVLDRVSSPCIDAGDPWADISKEPIPDGEIINMGAYGGTRYASLSEILSIEPDFNKDGIIDELDLSDLVEEWITASGLLNP